MQSLKKFIHNLFIPHELNNYRAKSLHFNFLTLYLIITLVLTFFFKTIYTTGDVLGFATDITANKLFQLTNDERKQNNLSTLSYSDQLAQAAQKKAQNMFAENYWDHYSPDGKTPWDFILGTGYQYEFAGENLAKNFMFSQGVIDAWMNSPSHKENILRKEYTQVGFAVANGVINGEQTTLVVQMLATPTVTTIAKQPQPVVTKAVTQPLPTTLPEINQNQAVLAQKAPSNSFTLAQISVNISFVFMLFFAVAVFMDFYFAAKLHIIRIGSKNLAHLIFIGFLFIALFIFTKGTIL